MKKLNLEKLKYSSEEILQRNQMAKIYGGEDPRNNGHWYCTCGNGPAFLVYVTDGTDPTFVANCGQQIAHCSEA